MTRVAVPFAAALLLGAFCTSARGADASLAADERAIRATWSELDAAWAERNVDRISRLFAKDAVFAFLPGERRLDGRPAIHAHFAAQFPRQSPELRHVTDVRSVRPLADGFAIVDAGVRVLRSGGQGADDTLLRAFAVLAVMTRAADAWEILEIRAFRLPDEAAGAQSRADPSAAPCIDRATAAEMAKTLLAGGALLSAIGELTPEEQGQLDLLNPFTRPAFCPGAVSDRLELAGPSPAAH